MKKYLLIILPLLVLTLFFYDNKSYIEKQYDFIYKDESLKGKFILPKDKKADTLLIFVHGDGHIAYDAYGYYESLWNSLAKNGIASYSWNKKGVEGSEGNWLEQSMEDRANEVITAIKQIKKEKNFKKIGIIGYSQAGWVVPKLSKIESIQDFTILISPAINWMEQKKFYEQNHQAKNKKISEDRKTFIKLNKNSDSTNDISALKMPVLLLLGEDDKSVDIKNTKEVYKEKLGLNLKVKTFENINHGMLKTKYFNEGESGLTLLLKVIFLEEEAFASDYFETIITWIKSNK